MLSGDLPNMKDKPDLIKFEDGVPFLGCLRRGGKCDTVFGPAFFFDFECQDGKERKLIKKSAFLAGLINQFDAGAILRIIKRGEGKQTRWSVEEYVPDPIEDAIKGGK